MSTKREAESNSPNSEENGASIPTASSNKRIKTATAATSSKRATRASTGAPITLTAKGSLYRAHKDTGNSSDEAEPPSSSRPKVISTGQSSSVSASAATGNHGESTSTGVPRGSATQRARKQEGDSKCSSSLGNSSKNSSGTRAEYSQANNGGAETQTGGGGGGEGGRGKMGGRGSGSVAVGGVNVSSGGVPADGEGEPPPMLSADGDAPSAPPRRRGRKGRSIYRGVCVTREGKWRAVIYKERKQLYLGVYESELEAAKAHDRAARFHFPDKAMTNFESEEEADRLLKSEEQQRRVKQEVDRDLAPVRRLGALAAAGRELEGYPDPQQRASPAARPRPESGRVRRAFGGNQGSHLGASAGVEAEVLEGDYETPPWDEEASGYRSRPPSPTDTFEDQREYSGSCTAGQGSSCSMESSNEEGKGSPRDSSGASRPNESFSSGWKRESNGASGENDYEIYDRYRKARANGEREESEDAADSRGSRGRTEAAEARDWRGGPGSVTADRRSNTGPAFPSHPKSQQEALPDERSVGVIDGGGAGPGKWSGRADGVHPGRLDHGQWQARFEHGSGKGDGKGDQFYWEVHGRGGRAWDSGGDAPGTTGNRGPSGMVAMNAMVEGEHVADNRHASWSSRRHVSGKASSNRGGGHTRSPRPEHIAIIEAKMARARQEDAETAAAAEAAMVMAGYGGDWLRRGASRNESGKGNRTRGTGSRVDIDADEGKVDNARALDAARHPRHRQRPHITVRASRGSNGTQLSSEGRTAVGDIEQAAEKCGSGTEHDAWRRGGRELIRGKPEESSGWGSDWGRRASGDPHDNVYPTSTRRGGVGQGRSRNWNVSTRDSEGFLGDADGRGGLVDIRRSYAQKRVAAAAAAAGVEPITVAAAAAAVALKYSHRIPNGGNGHGRSGRSSDASYRWPGGAASEPGNNGRGGSGFRNGDVAVSAHEGKYMGSPGPAYARDRTAREWSGPGAVEGSSKGEFSPLYRDGREGAPRPPGAAGPMRGYASGISNAGGSSISRQGIFAMSSPPRPVDEAERDRPLRRIKRTPHDVYACGGFDVPLKNSDGGHRTGGGESEGRSADGINAHGSTAEAGGVARQLNPGAEEHNPRKRFFANGTSDTKRDSGVIGTAGDGGASRALAGNGKRSGEISKESQAVNTMGCHDTEEQGSDKGANGVFSSKRIEGDDKDPPAAGKGGSQDRAS